MAGVKVFVGSLPPGTPEDLLISKFAEIGSAVQQVIMKPEQRYAFVFFSSTEEAQLACEGMNGQTLNGATLNVKLASNQQAGGAASWGGGGAGGGGGGGGIAPPPPPVHPGKGGGKGCGKAGGMMAPQQSSGDRIYLKGLPAGLTDDALRELFAAYGTIQDAKVLVADGKSNDGSGQSVGILRMGSQEEAAWMVENLNGNMAEGLSRPIEVSFAGARTKGGAGGGGPYQQPPQQATWGPPQPPAAVYGGKGGGGGGGASASVPSVLALKTQVSPGCKLYVKGLPQTADDAYLFKVFSPWARLLEATALNKGMFCIGFVTCLTEPEAQECIANVSGVQLTDGTTLQVSIKVAK